MIIVSYDIHSDRLRTKISKALISYGLHRIQYSVFIGSVGRREIKNLWTKLGTMVKLGTWKKGDSIYLIPINRKDIPSIRVYGSWPERWSEMSGEKLTLIL